VWSKTAGMLYLLGVLDAKLGSRLEGALLPLGSRSVMRPGPSCVCERRPGPPRATLPPDTVVEGLTGMPTPGADAGTTCT
jgi:hypothetical protein